MPPSLSPDGVVISVAQSRQVNRTDHRCHSIRVHSVCTDGPQRARNGDVYARRTGDCHGRRSSGTPRQAAVRRRGTATHICAMCAGRASARRGARVTYL